MTRIALPPTSSPDLVAWATFDGGMLMLHLEGNADMRVQESIDAIRGCIHEEALRHRVSEVSVDLLLLEFMNSSCLKSFVTWITMIQDLEVSSRYALRFLSNPAFLWQKRSLHALSSFAVDVVKVQHVPPVGGA